MEQKVRFVCSSPVWEFDQEK